MTTLANSSCASCSSSSSLLIFVLLRCVDTSHLIVAFLERGDMSGSEHMYGGCFPFTGLSAMIVDTTIAPHHRDIINRPSSFS